MIILNLFGKSWWVFGLLNILCCFFNPYIGLFSLFPIAGNFIMFCIIVNVKVRTRKKLSSNFSNEIYRESNTLLKISNTTKKALTLGGYFCSVFFFLINTLVSLCVWALASGNLGDLAPKFCTPFIIWSEQNLLSISMVLLIASIVLSFVNCIAVIIRIKAINLSIEK